MKIGLLADLHSNAPAARAVFSKLSLQNVDRCLCAGDVVGYYPFPNETIELVEQNDVEAVLGNHDMAVISGDTTGFSIKATRAIDWTRRNISEQSLEQLCQYPEVQKLSIEGREIVIVHGSPSNPLNEYIYPDEITEKRIHDWFDTSPDILLLGHTHIPFEKMIGDVLIVNPGSVGQPRDKDNRPSFATLDLESLSVEFDRVAYNIEETASKTKEYLPIQLAERLSAGE